MKHVKIVDGKWTLVSVRDTDSGYRGVAMSRDKWRAYIHVDREQVYLGRFATKEEAALAYDRAALRLFGPNAHVNFPC
jgi:hypothetical protein